MTASAIYEGAVTHARLAPKLHKFRYRVFSLLIDLDELPRLDKLRWFAWNRAGILSFHDNDHGDGKNLRAWLDSELSREGIVADGARRVLCYPRIFGYVFNPLSVWFCHRKDETLAAIVYEVHNTYGERRAYVLRTETNDGVVRQSCAKDMYVSPFLSMNCTYRFEIRPPGEAVSIAIHELEAAQPILNACFSGTRAALTDRNLASCLLRHPLMTVKIVAAIHFEALRLWLKRIPHHAHTKQAAPIA
ncbi:MAG TPA: DUF1365 domain-containing protein [Rhizomicrobium sp.]|jgi:hypothetical protein|nr:DUF1365 domain-containing protein [Rhizomicrobium sp.]